MKRTIIFICMITLFALFCTAQENEEEKNKLDGSALFQPIRKGDKFIKMGLSLGIPLFNSSKEKIAINPKIYPGGTIDLGFAYYVTNGLSLGGSLSLQFYPTLAKNLYFSVPITFDVGYTVAAAKWRIPFEAGIGGALQIYNGNGAKYFGMLFRFEAGLFYQYTPEWSIGGGISWSVVPQWYKETYYNRTGNFLNIKFGARYHF